MLLCRRGNGFLRSRHFRRRCRFGCRARTVAAFGPEIAPRTETVLRALLAALETALSHHSARRKENQTLALGAAVALNETRNVIPAARTALAALWASRAALALAAFGTSRAALALAAFGTPRAALALTAFGAFGRALALAFALAGLNALALACRRGRTALAPLAANARLAFFALAHGGWLLRKCHCCRYHGSDHHQFLHFSFSFMFSFQVLSSRSTFLSRVDAAYYSKYPRALC